MSELNDIAKCSVCGRGVAFTRVPFGDGVSLRFARHRKAEPGRGGKAPWCEGLFVGRRGVEPARRRRGPRPAWTKWPLRKVVDPTYYVPVELGDGMTTYVEHELLECDHHYPPKTGHMGRTFPSARRCRKCPRNK